MKFNLNKFLALPLLLAGSLAFFSSCNKDVEDPEPVPTQSSSGQSIMQIINSDANFSILKAAIAKASTSTATSPSLSVLLSDSTGVYTFFAPTDAAFQLSFQLLGIPPTVGIAAFRAGQIDSILRYHIVGGQKLVSSALPVAFPNLQVPTLLELAKPSITLPPGLRMSLYPSKRGTTAWANNIPITAADVQASNGVIHKVAVVVAPPQEVLWARIATDPDLEYLKAAILRADQATPSPGLVAALSNPAANLTVFAPKDAAFQQVLTAQITAALVAQNVPLATAQQMAANLASTPAVFGDPTVATVLTPTTIAGLVSYHLLTSRAFSVNLPIAATAYPTALASKIPGATVSLQAAFAPTGVTAATVKGNANATASNIQINPAMAPFGTSDQNYVNGTLHVIDQVLLPQ